VKALWSFKAHLVALIVFVGYPKGEFNWGCRDGNPVRNQLDHPDSLSPMICKGNAG